MCNDGTVSLCAISPATAGKRRGCQMSHRVAELEARLKALKALAEAVSQEKITEELVGVIHRPGWTTVAEAALVEAMTEALHAQLQVFQGGLRNLGSSAGLKRDLV
jgi:hypothetical protein